MLDFCHPTDLNLIKNIYKAMIEKSQIPGGKYCSKPYRFLTQNGCYILLETEWTSFINPWTRKLEFIVGNHRVFQGKQYI